MIVDDSLMASLLEKARASERLRANFDLRNSAEDGSQRMLNAIMPGSVVPIHRHRASSESVVCLKGALAEIIYGDSGKELERYELNADGPVRMCVIPKGAWHTVEVTEECVIFESKDGAFSPLSPDDILG